MQPRTYKLIRQNDIYFCDNITYIEPFGSREMLFLQENMQIISDSGGTQKNPISQKYFILILWRKQAPETV